jgi:hypothetical protein
MNEIPKFLQGIDTDSILDIENQMQAFSESHYAKQNKLFEQDRDGFFSRLIDKMNAIDICINQRTGESLLLVQKTNELASLAFHYYLNRIFAAPGSVNRPYYLGEALGRADDAQSELNKRQIGSEYIFEQDELRTRIGNILSQDDETKAKKDIAYMYENEISAIVDEFINKR